MPFTMYAKEYQTTRDGYISMSDSRKYHGS